jgi:polar amino acid transport system substrate-binding protein
MMRRSLASVALGALLLAACAEEPTVTEPTGPTPTDPAACADANRDAFETPGVLTVGTGNPAYPPWWEGGESPGSEFEFNDPAKGQGYEGAVVAEVAERLGFAFPDEVVFVAVGFNKSFAPGPKPFDFVLQQISYKPERDESVDFSESYYDVNQAVVALEGSPIADATTIAELRDAKLGAPVGTTSLDVIEDIIKPTVEPATYDDLALAVQDLKAGAIAGIVVDLPTAFFVTAVQVPEGVVVGQIETEEYLAMAFESGSPLVECVNLALRQMKADGTLEAIHDRWLPAEVVDAPFLT